MTALKWEEPPATPHGRGRAFWPSLLRELDTRPGQWAVVAEDVAASVASYLKKTYPEYEFTLRGVKNNRAEKLYGRRRSEAPAEAPA